MDMQICITGGAGFIGSHFVNYLDRLRANGLFKGQMIVYDRLTYAGDLNRIKTRDYIFIKGDVTDQELFYQTLVTHRITHVVHFAAETHVDRSIRDVTDFVKTNIIGTATVLACASRYWQTLPEKFNGKQMIHISTDEVYGAVSIEDTPANEKTPLAPSNPYAATKAAADQLVLGEINGNAFPACIVRSSNNFGHHQNTEKLIPKVIECLRANRPIPIYGDGSQMRTWLSANTFATFIYALMSQAFSGEIINIRGEETLTNLELVQRIRASYTRIVGRESAPVMHIADRKNHDRFYHIDNNKQRIRFPEIEFESLTAFINEALKDL